MINSVQLYTKKSFNTKGKSLIDVCSTNYIVLLTSQEASLVFHSTKCVWRSDLQDHLSFVEGGL